MIGRNVSLKRKLIEQSSLLNLLMPHHDSVPSRRLNQRISPSATANFFNKLSHHRTSGSARALSVLPPGTDIKRPPQHVHSVPTSDIDQRWRLSQRGS